MKFIYLGLLITIFLSCNNNKDIYLKDIEIINSITKNKYIFAELKSIDIDSICELSKQNLRRYDNTLNKQVLIDLVNSFKDSHVQLIENSTQISFYPMPRFLRDSGLFKEDVITSYFTDSELRSVNKIYRYGILDKNIGYLQIKSFPSDKNKISYLDTIFDKLKHTDGLIIDIRHNFGGSSDAVYYCIEKIIQDTLIGVQWQDYKKNKFPIAKYHPMANNYKNPVVLLINGLTYSAGENFANLCKRIDHVTVIGDTTGGGGGVPESFTLPSGLILSLPTREMLAYDDKHVEDNGIAPDILVINKQSDIDNKIDKQFEYAMM